MVTVGCGDWSARSASSFYDKDSNHAEQLLEKLCKLRQSTSFCDITFLVDGDTFPAHKCIMAASSDYFGAMLAGNFREGSLEKVPLEGISAAAFREILTYVYEGEIMLGATTVMTVYEAADMMQYDYVKAQCICYMIDNISPANCLDYLLMAKQHSLSEVQRKAEQCLYKNFDIISKSDKFLDLPFVIVDGILDSDEIHADEKNVLEAICAWLKTHRDIEKCQKEQLVEHLRYGLLNSSDIEILKENQTALGQENSLMLREKMLSFFMDPRNQPLKAGKFCRPRGCVCLVTVGGTTAMSEVEKQMHVFPLEPFTRTDISDFECGVTFPIVSSLDQPLPGPRTQSLVVTKGNFLYVCGGKNSEGLELHVEPSLHRYDMLQGYWTQLRSMNTARYQHAGAVLDNSIIVIGGHDKYGQILASVEVYHISEDKWETKNNFCYPVCQMAACNLQGKVYVSGGREDNNSLSNSIHQYDDVTDCWLLKGYMSAGLCSHGMCAAENNIYIIGGESRNQEAEPNIKASFRRFDVSGGHLKQRKLTAVPYFLAQTSAICYNKWLFVVGGYGRKSDSSQMQNMQDVILTYNIKEKTWYEHHLALPRGLQDVASALLIFPYSTIKSDS